jgi:ribosomal protein L1
MNKDFAIQDVFNTAKEASKERKFREAVEVVLRLNVDPTKGG